MARTVPLSTKSEAKTYMLMGFPGDGVDGAERAIRHDLPTFTSTHTTFNLIAGDVEFLLDFFSPVSPKNYTRQSMPYSYLSVSAKVASPHQIQIFSAIDNTWTGQGSAPHGNLTHSQGVATFDVHNPYEVMFDEHGESQALWGHTVFSALYNDPASEVSESQLATSGCGAAKSLYSKFVKDGKIQSEGAPFGCPTDALYSHVYNLDKVQSSSTVTFAVGLYQESTISYLDEPQTYYFRSEFPTISSSIRAFFEDLLPATEESHKLDDLIRTNGDAISSNYTDILFASVRQSFAAIQLTIPSATLSTKPSDVNAFLKEISSDGNVNSVDVLYPTFPIWLVLAPEYIQLTLQPLLAYLVRPDCGWTRKELPHDLGNQYPNATGHNDNRLEVLMGREENMPIQVTSSLFSMLLSYVNATNDTAFPARFSGERGRWILETYADMLVEKGLHPPSQLTTVDALHSIANTTQLAISAAIGVSAAGALLGLQNYTIAGAEMMRKLVEDGESMGVISSSPPGHDDRDDKGSKHFTYDYGLRSPSSFSLEFPLFADKLANLGKGNTFAREAYEMQSTFYDSLLNPDPEPSNNHNEYLPLALRYSSQATWGIVDWSFWAAASVRDTIKGKEVVKGVVDGVWKFLMKGGGLDGKQGAVPFGTKYEVDGVERGKWIGNRARSTVGAVWALLALDVAREEKWGKGAWNW